MNTIQSQQIADIRRRVSSVRKALHKAGSTRKNRVVEVADLKTESKLMSSVELTGTLASTRDTDPVYYSENMSVVAKENRTLRPDKTTRYTYKKDLHREEYTIIENDGSALSLSTDDRTGAYTLSTPDGILNHNPEPVPVELDIHTSKADQDHSLVSSTSQTTAREVSEAQYPEPGHSRELPKPRERVVGRSISFRNGLSIEADLASESVVINRVGQEAIVLQPYALELPDTTKAPHSAEQASRHVGTHSPTELAKGGWVLLDALSHHGTDVAISPRDGSIVHFDGTRSQMLALRDDGDVRSKPRPRVCRTTHTEGPSGKITRTHYSEARLEKTVKSPLRDSPYYQGKRYEMRGRPSEGNFAYTSSYENTLFHPILRPEDVMSR